ncbi:fibronectin type III domain-containing protein [Hymenobacter terricola]|uniref:fibronectin type III domain-containing protein n=1 Tax=Hymenobacter terricola TaxID=2819236 RepID=UPI001B308AFA|nr:fibronectin type III domain-containing protein [Hymenobacter terricola]
MAAELDVLRPAAPAGGWRARVALLLVLWLAGLTGAWAQITVPAGNPVGSTSRKPYGNYFGYERSAALYTANEISGSGTITSVGFYLEAASGAAATPARIYLKTTTAPDFAAATTVATEEGGATLVYDATIPAASFGAAGWVTVTLATPFAYNGTDNLEVVVEANGGGSGTESSAAKTFRFTSTSAATRFESWQNDGLAPTGTGSLGTFRPNLQLAGLVPLACAAPTGLSISNITPTSASIAFTAGNGNTSYTVTYTPAGGAATTVSPAPTAPFVVLSGLTPGTTYAVSVAGNCSGSTTSAAASTTFATLVVPPAFAVTRSASAAYTSIASTGSSFIFSGTSTDDNTSDAVSLTGFNFNYLGTAVTGFKACTNGWLTFNTAETSTAYNNNLGSGSITQQLAPFWEDLVCQGNPGTAAALASSMKYQLTGPAGSRVLTVEWIGMETFNNPGPSLNFQVRLYEGTSTIQYVYGNMSGFDGSADYTYSYSLGLNGLANVAMGNYLAQQVANSAYFANTNAGTLGSGANGLNVVPSCFSQVQFVPAGSFSSGPAPVATAPANNEPASALALAVGSAAPTDFCAVFTSANATATPGIAACAAAAPGTPDDDVWFSFSLPGAGNTTLALRSSGGYDGVLQLFSGTPGSLVPVACQNATGPGLTETYANASLPAGTYYVRVFEAGAGSGTSGTFVLSVFATPAIPANDECAGAIGLTPTSTCAPTTGTTLGATASAGITACTGTADDDVWYRFTATATAQTITVQSASGFDAVLQVFSGACGSLGSTSCVNGTSTGGLETVSLTGLTVSSVYYVRVYHGGSGSGTGSFTICVATSCDAPTALAATTPSPTTARLSWVAGAGGATFAVEYGPTGFTPGTGTTIAAATSPQVVTGLTANTAYQFYVVQTCGAGLTAPAGPGAFTTPIAPPANDQCSGAVAIACGQTLAGTTLGATMSGDPTATCGPTVSSQGGVFYAFTGTGDVVTATTCAGPTATTGDTKLFVFRGTCTALTCVDGNDDTLLCTNGLASSVTFTSTAGTQYYIFVQGFSSDLNFGLSLTCAAPVTNLVVSTPQNVSGTYNNVTVLSGGVATLAGALTVNGALTVQSGGVLAQNCQPLTGPGSFVLQAGGELQICEPAGIAATGATGAIQVTGPRTYAADASYTYNGTAAQLTGAGLPAQVRNLTVNNAPGLTLSQGVSITQVARLQSGNLATSGQGFTLLSSATGTALIDNIGGVVIGTGTMQRAVTNAITGPAYRHFSAPVANTTLGDLSTTGFAPTLNPAYNSSATPSLITPFPTVFGYDQARLATVTSNYGAFDKGWFSPAGATDLMQPTRGYTANAPATATPIDFVGTFNNAAQNSGALNRGTDAQAGWQLLGNPYPSPLDWSTVAAAQRPGMDGAMYVYQSTGQYAGTYRSYDNGIGASPLIDAGSGYFARVSAPGTPGAVNLTNANRVTTFGPQPTFGRGAADARPQLQLQLAGAGLLDDAFLYLEAGATAGLDAPYDATKLPNPAGLDLASLSGTTPLAINGLAPLANTDVVVPLTLRVPQAGSFSLEAANLANFGTATVYLRDALTGTRQVLAPGARYAFTLATATAGTGRFSVVFRPATVTATHSELSSASVSLYPNPAHASFTLLLPPLAGQHEVRASLVNALGQVVLSRTISLTAAGATAEFATLALASGVYTLQLQTNNQALTKRVVVE